MTAPDHLLRMAASAALVVAVWTLLALGGALREWLGADAAVAASFAAATALTWATRPVRAGVRVRRRVACACTGLAFAAGAASLPAWVALLTPVGLALGLAPRAPAPPLVGEPVHALSVALLAPLFEELLYRERLIPVLARRVGRAGAAVLASTAFALPHLEPWSVLAAFACGLLLGGVFCATESVAPCVAFHAGVNGAAVLTGVPPVHAAFPPVASALVAGACLALAVAGWRRARK